MSAFAKTAKIKSQKEKAKIQECIAFNLRFAYLTKPNYRTARIWQTYKGLAAITNRKNSSVANKPGTGSERTRDQMLAVLSRTRDAGIKMFYEAIQAGMLAKHPYPSCAAA